MSKVIKARWARKLMRAKYFVVLTDKESVIALEGTNPGDINDLVALHSQGAALADFHSKLGKLVKDHQKATEKLLNKEKIRSNRATTNPKSKVKKIKVRQE